MTLKVWCVAVCSSYFGITGVANPCFLIVFLYSAVHGLLCGLIVILIQNKCTVLNSNGENCLRLMRGYLVAWVLVLLLSFRTKNWSKQQLVRNFYFPSFFSFLDTHKIYFREKGKIPAEKKTPKPNGIFLWRYRGIGIWKKPRFRFRYTAHH